MEKIRDKPSLMEPPWPRFLLGRHSPATWVGNSRESWQKEQCGGAGGGAEEKTQLVKASRRT